jgi:uncharacterized damage-inducible protein DinB
VSWVRYNAADLVREVPVFPRGASPTRSELRRALLASGRAVEALLARTLRGEQKLKLFRQEPLRWLGYMVSHESHHRGQVVLTLKANGVRLPDDVLRRIWGDWGYTPW